MPDNTVPTDRSTAEHYSWGTGCDGWYFLKGADLSVIQERVPPNLEHRFCNRSTEDVVFLVISSPTTTGDRTNVGPT